MKKNNDKKIPRIVYLCQSEKEKDSTKSSRQKPDTAFFGCNRIKYPIEVTGWPTSLLFRTIAKISSPFCYALTVFKYRNADLLIVQDAFWLSGLLRRLKIVPPILYINIALYTVWNKSNLFVRWMMKMSAESMDCTVLLRKQYPPFYHFFHGRTLFVPLGIDTEFYSKMNTKPKESFVLSSGGFQRDYDAVLDFAEQYKKKVVIVMSGKNSISRKVPLNVVILKDISFSQIRELYNNCSCAVLFFEKDETGQHYYGQTTILELLTYNKPIITQYQEWFKDYELDRHPNIHFVTTPKEAVTIVKNVHSHESRSLIEKRFSTQNRAKKMEKIVEEMLHNSKTKNNRNEHTKL